MKKGNFSFIFTMSRKYIFRNLITYFRNVRIYLLINWKYVCVYTYIWKFLLRCLMARFRAVKYVLAIAKQFHKIDKRYAMRKDVFSMPSR